MRYSRLRGLRNRGQSREHSSRAASSICSRALENVSGRGTSKPSDFARKDFPIEKDGSVTGARLQEPPVSVKSVTGESAKARGRFSLARMLSFDPGRVRQKLIPWAMKGGLALVDQGVFAGSNFVMSILLARWLSPEQYGMYAVAFAILLFLLNFHQGLMLEPMLVFGSSVYRDCLRGYVEVLLLLHVGLSLAMAFGLFA